MAACLVVALAMACGDGGEDPRDAAAADGGGAPACTLTLYRDRDGDGVGAGEAGCRDRLETGLSHGAGDCDDGDAQRAPNFYERYGDGVDSNCDGADDPDSAADACSCRALRAPSEVMSACESGFDPTDAVQALAELDPATRSCEQAADLAIVLAAQCDSLCSQGPVYLAIANLGGLRSAPAQLSLEGSFRARPPRTPLAIAPLDPGQRTALIEITATGTFDITVATEGDCDADNDRLSVVVPDAHCGFEP